MTSFIALVVFNKTLAENVNKHDLCLRLLLRESN